MAATARYVSANLTPDAAAALRTLTAAMTVQKGRRVTTSDLVTALVSLGDADHGALLEELNRDSLTEGAR